MTARADIARIVGWLKDTPHFGDYVKMIEQRRDDAIVKLLAEQDEAKVPTQRGEARAYDALIREIATALKDQQK